jgi:hypothetical protein
LVVSAARAHAAGAAPAVFVDWKGLAKERYELRILRQRVHERLRQEGFAIAAHRRALVVHFLELSGQTLIVASLPGRQETRLLPWGGLSRHELVWLLAHKIVELVRALWVQVLRPEVAVPTATTEIPILTGEIASPSLSDAPLPSDAPSLEPLPPPPLPPLPPAPTLPFEFQTGGGVLNRGGAWSPAVHFGPKISSQHGFTLSMQGVYAAGVQGSVGEWQALVGSGYRFSINTVTFELGSLLGWSWQSGSGSGFVVSFPLILAVPLARHLSLELFYAPGLAPAALHSTPTPEGTCIFFQAPQGLHIAKARANSCDGTSDPPTPTGFRQEIALRLVLHTW